MEVGKPSPAPGPRLGAPRVLYADARFVAVDKPAGWLVVPGRGGARHETTLANWLSVARGLERVWVVHRLDRETSGVVLFALTPDAHRAACRALENRRAHKIYAALVHGVPDTDGGTVDLPLRPDPRRRNRGGMVASPEGGKQAVTEWRVQRRFPAHAVALLELHPKTGRTHQLRVHCASLGHPILRDSRYGAPPAGDALELPIARVALHAARLELPTLALEFSSPLPRDFAETLATIER